MKECINDSYTYWRWNRMKSYGACVWDDREIFINEKAHKRKPMEMLDSLVHENEHARAPELGEREILCIVAELLPTLTHPQIVRYFKLFYGTP